MSMTQIEAVRMLRKLADQIESGDQSIGELRQRVIRHAEAMPESNEFLLVDVFLVDAKNMKVIGQ